MAPKNSSSFTELLDNIIKPLAIVVFAMFSFFVHQLNDNIKGLSDEIHLVSSRQVKDEERIQAIEVARQITMPGYEKLQSDVQDMKTQLIQLVARTQTIADFVANNYKKHP